MKRMEKIEIKKSSGVYTYTIFEGDFKDLKNGWVEFTTTRGEVCKFRKEQVEGRKIETKRVGKIEK